MDLIGVSARVAVGMAKAASILGSDFTHYRPTGPVDPLLPGSAIGTVRSLVDRDGALGFQAPVPPDRPFGLLLADPRLVKTGDYLVGSDTYFVSRTSPFLPAWCVLCNAQLDILDTNQSMSAGANSYGGITGTTSAIVARGWPMSLLTKSRAGPEITTLPTDSRLAFYDVLMPSIPGLQLGLGLCLTDSAQQRFSVMSVEVTQYGCKLLVSLATT